MRTLTEQEIKEINSKHYDQGIFKEGAGIPSNIKELVVYSRYQSDGRGGSCWDDADTVNDTYYNDPPKDHFAVLDDVLKILKPNISLLQCREIERLKQDNSDTEYGYYGDYSTYRIEFIVLTDLYKALALMD
jgi:hypothetical protein